MNHDDVPQNATELMAEYLKLKAENNKLRDAKPSGGLKVSEKGAVSLYGMGKWPVTMYSEQWLKVLDRADEIKAFIQANQDRLKTKPLKQA